MWPDERIDSIKIAMSKERWKDIEPVFIQEDLSDDNRLVDYGMHRILFETFHYVSNQMQELLKIYNENLLSKPVFLTDLKEKKLEPYWLITPESIDCVIEKPYMKREEVVLYANKLKGSHLFRVQYQKQDYIVVSLLLAENILRRNFKGQCFIPITIK